MIFKRRILGSPYVCLDDYHTAKRETKKAAMPLLAGRVKVPVENQVENIRCTVVLNQNPQKRTGTVFERTGFSAHDIRRFVPCDLDGIPLPHLKKIGEKALDAARDLDPLGMREPTSTCKEYREELLGYFEKLFTEEGQKFIDVDELLNIARGFTGYGLAPSDAVRYTLYKASFPYHTLGWIRSSWVEVPHEVEMRSQFLQDHPRLLQGKTAGLKDFEVLQETIKFQESYWENVGKLEKLARRITEVQQFLKEASGPEKMKETLFNREYQGPSLENGKRALREVKDEYKNIGVGDWPSLKNLEEAAEWVRKTYVEPPVSTKRVVEKYLGTVDLLYRQISKIRNISQISPVRERIQEASLPRSLKCSLEKYADEKRTLLEQQRQTEVKELIEYTRKMKDISSSSAYEKKENLARDITGELLQVEAIKKEGEHFIGKDGQVYSVDTFDLRKWTAPGNSAKWQFACCRALSLLTGHRYKTFGEKAEEITRWWGNYETRKREQTKQELPEWERWVLLFTPMGIRAKKRIREHYQVPPTSQEATTIARFAGELPEEKEQKGAKISPSRKDKTFQTPIIGEAELFHTGQGRWVPAQILNRKYDRFTDTQKFYIRWKEDETRYGWVPKRQLRRIRLYPGQQN